MKFQLVRDGFTMIELLIVAAILGVLMVATGSTYQHQRELGYDGVRKTDLAKMKVAFEDYYNDKGCYPPLTTIQACGSAALAPYLSKVPCDPVSKKPYEYQVDPACHWYGLFTQLQNTADLDVKRIGCSPNCGGSEAGYNYAITNGIPIATLTQGSSPSGTPTPSPTPGVQGYACDPSGICSLYNDPQSKGCPVTFSDPQSCQQGCSIQANRCLQ